jgi:DNA-binding NarL/FixJ family response regulator
MGELKILIVDNHPEVLRQIENLLSQEEGFEICKSANMTNALDHVAKCKPDILLIDPFMEEGLCINSLKMIQELLPSVTIIVLAAIVDTSAQVELSKIGVKFILEKKLASEQLIDTLRLVAAIKTNGVKAGA